MEELRTMIENYRNELDSFIELNPTMRVRMIDISNQLTSDILVLMNKGIFSPSITVQTITSVKPTDYTYQSCKKQQYGSCMCQNKTYSL